MAADSIVGNLNRVTQVPNAVQRALDLRDPEDSQQQ